MYSKSESKYSSRVVDIQSCVLYEASPMLVSLSDQRVQLLAYPHQINLHLNYRVS